MTVGFLEQADEVLLLGRQLGHRQGLHEGLGRGLGLAIELDRLGRHHSRDLEAGARCDDLADQPELVGPARVEAASGEQEVAHHRVTHLSAQARDPAEAGDQPEAQLGEGEARGLLGDAEVAGEGELEAPAEADAVDHADRGDRQRVEAVERGVDPIEERAQPAHRAELGAGGEELVVELAQIRAGTKSARKGAVDDDRLGLLDVELVEEALEGREYAGADLVARRAGERELDHRRAVAVLTPGDHAKRSIRVRSSGPKAGRCASHRRGRSGIGKSG